MYELVYYIFFIIIYATFEANKVWWKRWFRIFFYPSTSENELLSRRSSSIVAAGIINVRLLGAHMTLYLYKCDFEGGPDGRLVSKWKNYSCFATERYLFHVLRKAGATSFVMPNKLLFGESCPCGIGQLF